MAVYTEACTLAGGYVLCTQIVQDSFLVLADQLFEAERPLYIAAL